MTKQTTKTKTEKPQVAGFQIPNESRQTQGIGMTQTYRHHRQIAYFEGAGLGNILSTPSKIGDSARSFSLPIESTCFAKYGGQRIASPICQSICSEYKMRDWGGGHENRAIANLPITKREDFDSLMIGAIRQSRRFNFKIHLSGDFYSIAYLEAWLRIMQECSDVKFWTYTRSWKIGSFRPLLSKLAALSNHKLHLSTDSSDDVEDMPDFPGRHLVYLSLHSADLPPMEVDIVFPSFIQTRFKPRQTMGSRVCPHYSGMESKPKDCVSCGICLP